MNRKENNEYKYERNGLQSKKERRKNKKLYLQIYLVPR